MRENGEVNREDVLSCGYSHTVILIGNTMKRTGY